MSQLRDKDTGCEWDKEQTYESIAPYTIEEAYEVDQKLVTIRNSINIYSKRLGMTIEEVFDALESKSRWQRPVEILNTIESLRQPAEMVSRLMAVMQSVTDTYEEEERNRLKENTFQPDPIGAANGIIATAPEFSNLFAIRGSSLQ